MPVISSSENTDTLEGREHKVSRGEAPVKTGKEDPVTESKKIGGE